MHSTALDRVRSQVGTNITQPVPAALGVARPEGENTVVVAARALADSLDEAFKPEGYEDTYRESVLALIKRKAAGEEIDLAAEEEPEHGDDLTAALEASLGAKAGR